MKISESATRLKRFIGLLLLSTVSIVIATKCRPYQTDDDYSTPELLITGVIIGHEINEISKFDLSDQKSPYPQYDHVYDSIFLNILGARKAVNYEWDEHDDLYGHWKADKRMWDSLGLKGNDTVMISINNYVCGDGAISYEYVLFSTGAKTLIGKVADKSFFFDNAYYAKFVEISPIWNERLMAKWNRDSLNEIKKRYATEQFDIVDGSHAYTRLIRAVIAPQGIQIDTISYESFDAPSVLERLFSLKETETKPTPYPDLYDEIFDEYWGEKKHDDRYFAEKVIDKKDFLAIWKMLDIQKDDTLYMSIFHGKCEKRNFRIALFQSRKMTFWAYNPLPDTNNNADRDDNLLVLESPTRMPGGMDGPRPYKRYGEAWEKGYYDRYTATPLSERQRLGMERPQFGKGDNRCRVTNARVIINGDKHRIDTMSYTADLSVSPRMFLSCE